MMLDEILAEVETGRMNGPYQAPDWWPVPSVTPSKGHRRTLLPLPHPDPYIAMACSIEHTGSDGRYDEEKIGGEADTTRLVLCMINRFTTLRITSCHLDSNSSAMSRTITCLALRVMGSAVKINFAAPTMLAAFLPFSSPYTSMTTLKTSSLQVRKKVTIRTPQNCFMHLTRIHTCQIQIIQLHMPCHVKVRPQLRHHQRNVVSG